MKSLSLVFVFCVFSASTVFSQTSKKDYMDEAGVLNKEGKTEEAITLMREADNIFPEDPDILALLGFYVGKSAGETSN
ncbi:tetratricopeptide repeat protein, partial [candidate division WOR-3 bacterium]|nr:tetratricopeptide repeat protein [candidate division WOR-3 bacterium]